MFSKIIITVYFHFRIDDIFPNNNIYLCGCDHTNNICLCSSKKKKLNKQANNTIFFPLEVLNISISYIQYTKYLVIRTHCNISSCTLCMLITTLTWPGMVLLLSSSYWHDCSPSLVEAWPMKN